MVPDTLINDIFDIRQRATDVHIEHFCDALYDVGFEIEEVENFDAAIYINFVKTDLVIARLEAQLIIRRMDKTFEVNAKLTLPEYPERSRTYIGTVTDDFSGIERYLWLLNQDCAQYIEAVSIEEDLYEWRGLRFKAPV